MFVDAYDEKKVKLCEFLKRVHGHNIHTPFELTEKIVNTIKADENAEVAVLFNIEFVFTLIALKGVDPKKITFFGDCSKKRQLVESWGCVYVNSDVLLNKKKCEKYKMKFDVVVGNPPFKNGNETGGKSSLWRKIVAKSWSLVKDGGTLTMIAPQFPNAAADLGDIFTKHQTTTVWTDIAHHFPRISSSFFAWSVTNTPKHTTTEFIDYGLQIDITSKTLPSDLRSISIFDKVMQGTLFECKSSPEYRHTSVADGKDDAHLYSAKTPNHTYAIRRTSGENYTMWGSVTPTDYTSSKVVMTFSGNPHYKFHDSNNPIGTIKFQSGHILVNNEIEGENLISLYKSKLYKFIQDQMASGGMRGKSFYEMPIMDLNKFWTDEELYKHFNLTQNEINLINEYN